MDHAGGAGASESDSASKSASSRTVCEVSRGTDRGAEVFSRGHFTI